MQDSARPAPVPLARRDREIVTVLFRCERKN